MSFVSFDSCRTQSSRCSLCAGTLHNPSFAIVQSTTGFAVAGEPGVKFETAWASTGRQAGVFGAGLFLHAGILPPDLPPHPLVADKPHRSQPEAKAQLDLWCNVGSMGLAFALILRARVRTAYTSGDCDKRLTAFLVSVTSRLHGPWPQSL
jgi:hypothetical protein